MCFSGQEWEFENPQRVTIKLTAEDDWEVNVDGRVLTLTRYGTGRFKAEEDAALRAAVIEIRREASARDTGSQ